MARILYWNINNFTDQRISTTKKRSRDDMEWGTGPAGPQHLRMILNTLRAVDPNTNNPVDLDFIVIVEVYARNGTPTEGQLIGGSGRDGCIRLLNSIANRLAGQWSLVPPVVTGAGGQREAVAVYYRRDRWYFLGPQTWPANYPAALRAGLPNRTIPGGYPYRPNQPERRSAGQWQFGIWRPGQNPDHDNNTHVLFPGAGQRKPWLIAFGRAGNANDLIRLMAIHTKPNSRFGGTAYANQGTANLADVYDMTARPADAANQIDVILGDFNVDNLTAANFQAGGPFGRLVGQPANPVNPAYTALIRPPAGLNAQYLSYYHTHGRPAYDSPGEAPARIIDMLNAPPYWQEAGHYPGQEYSGLSIDNVLVRYRGGAAPPASHHTTILARARQQPYQAPNPPPLVPPATGYYQAAVYMDETIGGLYQELTNTPALALQYDYNQRFREWDNYGLVYSTSDHFAILVDV